MTQREIDAVRAAAEVIRCLDGHLTTMGRGHNLSSVPKFEGYNFPDVLTYFANKAQIELNHPTETTHQ